MEARAPTVERAREFLSRRSGRVVSPDAAREATENLLGLFRLLAEWDVKAAGRRREFEKSEVRGIAKSMESAYPPPR